MASADRASRELEVAKRQSAEILREAKAKATEIVENAYVRAHKVDEQAKKRLSLRLIRLRVWLWLILSKKK